jgi:hypothetical protein
MYQTISIAAQSSAFATLTLVDRKSMAYSETGTRAAGA